jgi:hypothetical protein
MKELGCLPFESYTVVSACIYFIIIISIIIIVPTAEAQAFLMDYI